MQVETRTLKVPRPLAKELDRLAANDEITSHDLMLYILRAWVEEKDHRACVAAGG